MLHSESPFYSRDFNNPFSFGSTIYNIMTAQALYQELPSNEVKALHEANEFPDVMKIPCGEIIKQCWHYKVASV
jgi:hypothetical protein